MDWSKRLHITPGARPQLVILFRGGSHKTSPASESQHAQEKTGEDYLYADDQCGNCGNNDAERMRRIQYAKAGPLPGPNGVSRTDQTGQYQRDTQNQPPLQIHLNLIE